MMDNQHGSAVAVLGLALIGEQRDQVAGPLVDEVDEAEIPRGVADLDAGELV